MAQHRIWIAALWREGLLSIGEFHRRHSFGRLQEIMRHHGRRNDSRRTRRQPPPRRVSRAPFAKPELDPPSERHFWSRYQSPINGSDADVPAAQTVRRKIVSAGVMRGAQSAPVERFDMHRPERLNGDRALRFAQRRWPSTVALTTLFAQKFCCFSRGFRAFELLQSAIERRLVSRWSRQYLVRESPLRPRFNMRRPVGTPCRVLQSFRAHRRSSHVRENPICREIALLSKRAEIGRLPSCRPRARLKQPCRLRARICLHIVICRP